MRGRHATSVSIITLPTRKTRSSATPSLRRLSTPLGSVTNSQSLSASVRMRLISSGIVRSKLRNPASTCATGTNSLAATRAQASVELTSPTTSTRSGRSASTTGSKRFITSAVCTACEPEPTSRLTSGRGRCSSSKKSCDIFSS